MHMRLQVQVLALRQKEQKATREEQDMGKGRRKKRIEKRNEKKSQLGVVVHTFSPGTGEAETGGSPEFDTSLVYRASSQPASQPAIVRPSLKQKSSNNYYCEGLCSLFLLF